ncbi:chemotaxis protein CheB [Intrasporangium sp.]|uniref:chemotaxis protein CheB n=1 Tax=Intrasporangium sp. TaxID=1925024 RepID=UPI0033653D04
MPKRDVVVVGASAGGVEALRELVRRLPKGFPAAVLVVLHIPSGGRSALPEILARSSLLPCRHAEEGDHLTPGEILVAPPDRHLIVHDDAVTLSHGPKENGHRPAIDVLFRSAARVLGPRVVAVILSGALDDGAAGSVAVKLRGGTCVAQDPDEALHGSMPRAAVHSGGVDFVGPVAELAAILAGLVGEALPDPPADPSSLMKAETAMADLEPDALDDPERPGTPSGFSCPDCQGVLFQITEAGMVRYRCRVGHAWSTESLVAQQSASHETALWMALRSLQEKAALTSKLAEQAQERGHHLTAESFGGQSRDALEAAALVRDLIDELGGALPATEAVDGA